MALKAIKNAKKKAIPSQKKRDSKGVRQWWLKTGKPRAGKTPPDNSAWRLVTHRARQSSGVGNLEKGGGQGDCAQYHSRIGARASEIEPSFAAELGGLEEDS